MRARARSMAGPTWASIRQGPASTTQPPSSISGSTTTETEASGTRTCSSAGVMASSGWSRTTRSSPFGTRATARFTASMLSDGLRLSSRPKQRLGQFEGQLDGFVLGLGHGVGPMGPGGDGGGDEGVGQPGRLRRPGRLVARRRRRPTRPGSLPRNRRPARRRRGRWPVPTSRGRRAGRRPKVSAGAWRPASPRSTRLMARLDELIVTPGEHDLTGRLEFADGLHDGALGRLHL